MNTALNKLIKIVVIFYFIFIVVGLFATPLLSTPVDVTHYLNSLYPLAQNHTLRHIDGQLDYMILPALFIGSICIFFEKLLPVGKWLILISFVLSELTDFIEPAYTVYGLSLFTKEVSDMLQGVILVLLFIPMEKISGAAVHDQSTAKNKNQSIQIESKQMDDKPDDLFGIKSALKQTWKIMQIKGSKSAVWWTILAAVIIKLTFHFAVSHNPVLAHNSTQLMLFSFFLIPILLAPFIIGGMLIGTRQCRGEIISGKSGFAYLNRFKELAAASIIISSPLLIIHLFAGHVIVLPILFFWFIFLMLSTFTLLFIADKNISIQSSFIETFKIIRLNFPTAILFLLTIALIFVLYALSLGLVFKLSSSIGLFFFLALSFWVVPYTQLLFGVMYYQLFDRK